MTLIPKIIANPSVTATKRQYRYRFIITAILVGIVVGLMVFVYHHRQWAFLLIALFQVYYYLPPFDKRILQFCEEVTDTGTHLNIKKDGIDDEICYDNILDVQFQKATFCLNMPFVTIRLNHPSRVGDVFYFTGWGNDNELMAWSQRLNNALTQHPKTATLTQH